MMCLLQVVLKEMQEPVQHKVMVLDPYVVRIAKQSFIEKQSQ